MAKEKKKKQPVDPAEAAARFVTTDVDKTKARKWFVRARELADNKSWDYAVQCYVDGLGFWPEAVEEGHQPLRLAASERHFRDGKKPSFTETMKYNMTGKDAKKAMLNAAWLLSHDPFNISYMEGILKNANKLHCEEMQTNDFNWIDMIVVNLKSVEEIIEECAGNSEEVIEQLDIGGIAMIRSAAKNFRYVSVVVNKDRYTSVLHEMRARDGSIPFTTRYKLAQEAFSTTAKYDATLAKFLHDSEPPEE